MALFELESILEHLYQQAYPDNNTVTLMEDKLGCLCANIQNKKYKHHDNKRELDQIDPLESPEAFALLNDLDTLLDLAKRGIVDVPLLKGSADSRIETPDEHEYIVSGTHLLHDRQYNRLDFDDFLDYATSGLTRKPFLQRYADFRIDIFEGFERNPKEPSLEVPLVGKGCSILDCAIARQNMFVSTTTRFRVFEENSHEDMLLTMTFAPAKPPSRFQSAPLIEWERCNILIEKKPLLKFEEANNSKEYRFLFEACRLTLHLPAYLDFMYDLIVTEKVPIREIPKRQHSKSLINQRRPGPKFKLIRSIRVIRIEKGMKSKSRTWTAPRYSFAVKGHWRHLKSDQKGRDVFGDPIFGKTWVHKYTKYKSLESHATTVCEVDPQVTINIKQTLSYARDVIESHRKAGDIVAAEPMDNKNIKEPSTEWRFTERAKLNAALRFAIMKRDGFRCQLCGRDASKDNNLRLEVDHIVPIMRWGRTVESNLQTLCRECNRGKRDSSMEK